MKNYISSMLTVVISGFTSCNKKSKDKILNRFISSEPKNNNLPPPNISVTTTKTFPLVNADLSAAIKIS